MRKQRISKTYIFIACEGTQTEYRYFNSFAKSDCKDDKKHYLYCGTGKHEADCQGTKCVAGHIRRKEYITNYDKSNGNLYARIGDRQAVAFENAAWLRWKKQKDLHAANGQIYAINPYSDVDILLKRLFKIEQNIVWGNLNETISFGRFSVYVSINAQNIQLQIMNTGKSSEKLTANHFFITDENGYKSPLNLETFIFLGNLESEDFDLTPSVLTDALKHPFTSLATTA